MDLIQISENSKQNKVLQIVFEVILSLALSIGCWFTIFSMFPCPLNQTLAIILISGCPLLFYFISKFTGIGRYMIFYVFIAVALFFLLMYQPVWNGFLLFANIVVEVLNEQLALGMVGFETAGDVDQWTTDTLFAFIPVILLVSVSIAHSVIYKEVILGLSLTALPVVIGLCLKAIPSIWILALLFLAWTGLFVLSAVAKPEIPGRKKYIYIQNEKQSSLPVIFLTIILLILLAYILIFSDESYSPPKTVDALQSKVVEAEEHLRYDKLNGADVDGLSCGDLTATHPIVYTENKVMDVRMDVPQSMYLRGFTGGFYQDEKWSSSEDWAYSGEYKGLTQWLAQQNFYPWCQLNDLYRISEDYDLINVDVENVNASSKYTYLPYEAAIAGDITPDKVNYYRDAGTLSKGIMGDREYSFTTFIPKYVGYSNGKMNRWISSLREKAGYDEYADNEAIYRRFVNDTYLYIPEEADAALKGKSKLIQSISGKDIDTVIFGIRNEFTKNYVYDLESESAPKDRDELEYFMNESLLGNDMHFATAATMLFRKAGIPARYAEGYYISPERVQLYTELDNVRMDIPDSYAHSWVEIYVDEIGWTPVEVIPGYFEMNKTETDDEELDEELKSEQEKYNKRPQPVDNEPEEKETEEKRINPVWFIIALIVLLIVLFEIIGRYRMRRIRAAFGSIYTEKQVYDMYRYIEKLMKFDKMKLPANPYEKSDAVSEIYDGNTDMKFRDMLDNVSAVRFGEKTWSEDMHKETALYIEQLTELIYEKQTKFKKFIMRFVYFFV